MGREKAEVALLTRGDVAQTGLLSSASLAATRWAEKAAYTSGPAGPPNRIRFASMRATRSCAARLQRRSRY